MANKKKEWNEKYPKSLLGKRYVFFSSLIEDNPSLAANVQSHFSKINNSFFKKPEEKSTSQDKIQYIEQYIDFLGKLIETERDAELKYLNNLLQKINSLDKDKILEKLGITEELENLNFSNFNYKKITLLLNNLKQENETFKQAVLAQLNNIEIFEHNLEEYNNEHPDEQLIEKLKENFFEDRGQYNKMFKEILMKSFQDEKGKKMSWNEGPLQEIKDIIDSNIREISSSSEIRSIIRDVAQNSKNNQKFEVIIKRLVISMGLKKIKIKDFYKKDPSKLKEELTKINNSFLMNIQSEKPFARITRDPLILYSSLEEQALKTGEKLTDRLLKISSDEQQIEIIKRYCAKYKDKNVDLDEIKAKAEKSSSYKGQLTKELKAGIFSAREQWEKEQSEKGISFLNEEDLNQAFLQTIDPNAITYDKIATSLNLKINLDSIAEIASQPYVKQEIINMVQNIKNNYTPGVSQNLKTDFTITWNWNDKTLYSIIENSSKRNDSKTNNLVRNLEERMNLLQENFLKDYFKKGKGTTNISQAYRSYIGQLYLLAKDFKKLYSQLYKDSEAQAQLIDYINKEILESVTVKEYVKYDPKIGYEAGALGAGGLVINAVPNILKMYELGGITTIDANLIIEALLNCGPDMLAPENLVENFKTYLLGGAAMVLFDEGFSNAQTILDLSKSFFGIKGVNGPSQVHLLLLNNTYYPFSFVLQQIYNNLTPLLKELEIMAKHPQDEVITQNSLNLVNNVKLKSEEEWGELGAPNKTAARWNEMSNIAQNSVTITFTFMGGMLDILQNLAQAFNV